MRRIGSVLTLLITVLVALHPCASASATMGEAAPALVVPELNGKTFDLSSERGKVVIINFWATWCSSCRDEMPALNAFYRRYHDEGLAMIGVSADRPHDRSEVIKMMAKISYPVAMMRDADSNGFGSPAILPTTFIVDREGIVRTKLTPDQTRITGNSLAALVLPLLQSKTASTNLGGPQTTSAR
jgi:cytochrome c biogenesis protein CcmG, thiol:disulfide interchange protein DsbE